MIPSVTSHLQQNFHIFNQATGYAIAHIWCLSQARINWEGCCRKGIRHKNGGMREVGRWLVWMEWRPVGLSVFLPLLSSLAPYSPEEDFFWHLLPPPENWKRPPVRPRITWLNTIQRDLRAYKLTLNEAVDLAQNRPLWRLMSTYGATHSSWCMPKTCPCTPMVKSLGRHVQ